MCKESLIFSNSVHLDPRTGLPEKILKGDHQRIILAKLESNWPSRFRGKKIKISSPFSIFSNSGHVGWISGFPISTFIFLPELFPSSQRCKYCVNDEQSYTFL